MRTCRVRYSAHWLFLREQLLLLIFCLVLACLLVLSNLIPADPKTRNVNAATRNRSQPCLRSRYSRPHSSSTRTPWRVEEALLSGSRARRLVSWQCTYVLCKYLPRGQTVLLLRLNELKRGMWNVLMVNPVVSRFLCMEALFPSMPQTQCVYVYIFGLCLQHFCLPTLVGLNPTLLDTTALTSGENVREKGCAHDCFSRW